MRRTGHIRERSPGSYELRCSLGTAPATGRRKMATATVRGSRGCRIGLASSRYRLSRSS